MQQNIEFERCIDFLVRMIDKYGREMRQQRSNVFLEYSGVWEYNKTSFLHKSENFKRMIGKADESL